MECCVALGAVGQVDPRPVVAPQEDRGSLRHSSKDASKVAKRDPDKEQQHRERPASDERLLGTATSLATEHTSQHEHGNPPAIERRDREQVQDRKVGGEECSDLQEAAEPEPFSRASNSNGNANGTGKCWCFAVGAKWCAHQFR
jgi:hypothetical protein